MEDLRKQAERFGADLRYGVATAANLAEAPYKITIDDEKMIEAETLIIATGAAAKYLGRWTDIFNSIDYLSIFRPEILDVMDRLKAEGFRLAVASATNIEQVERILKENGVASRLERMISASTFKRSKPDPAVYLYTAEQMGLQPEECLVIEDSTVGITAGHCAGMTVAALIDNRFSFDRSLADYELNSLEEIVPLAEKIRDLK